MRFRVVTATTEVQSSAQLYDTTVHVNRDARTEPRIAAQVLGCPRSGTDRTEYRSCSPAARAPRPESRGWSVNGHAYLRPASAAVCVLPPRRPPFRGQALRPANGIDTVHHWRNPIAVMDREMQRVASPRVVFTCDTSAGLAPKEPVWLTRDTCPGFWPARSPPLPRLAIRDRGPGLSGAHSV